MEKSGGQVLSHANLSRFQVFGGDLSTTVNGYSSWMAMKCTNYPLSIKTAFRAAALLHGFPVEGLIADIAGEKHQPDAQTMYAGGTEYVAIPATSDIHAIPVEEDFRE